MDQAQNKEKKKEPLTERNKNECNVLACFLNAKGLCINCNDADICKFPGFGGDVIFCEEHSSNFDNKRQDRFSNRMPTNVPSLAVNI